MQIPKDQTRKLLLKTAKEAFLQKGYKAVSMREISKLSGVGLSNIYNYYPCKDELLSVVLHPLLEAMNAMLDNHNRDENLTLEIFTSEDYYRKSMQEMMGIITHYRKEMKLLINETQDTCFKDYLEHWCEKSSKLGMEYLYRMNERFPELHTKISPLFMNFSCSLWITMIKEVVLHEDLTKENMESFISEYIQFSTGGWKNLMRVENVRKGK